jgi:hypothetical protein
MRIAITTRSLGRFRKLKSGDKVVTVTPRKWKKAQLDLVTVEWNSMKSDKIVNGGMGEWLKPAVLKTVDGETRPGVRIPLPPPSYPI